MRPGPYVVLAVSDTGHGMDKKTLSHIFEPFFTTKGVGKGTGLGLSTVYGIVKQSDGYVWVYSEPGLGTSFKVYLPLRVEAAAPSPEVPAPVRSRAGETILLVEDETSVRHMMRRALEGAGYRVIDAGTASAALQLLTRHTGEISLVLTDVVMPGQSGRELADLVSDLAPDIQVLFTSGYTDSDIAGRGLLEPGAAFLQKPFTTDTLVRAVRDRLEVATRPTGSETDGAA
jgi:CheY-like chemotaxis protein